MSIWGIIQFILLGIFFFIEAAPLIEEIKFKGENITATESFQRHLRDAFYQRAYNCWIAAFLYIALLIFAGIQFITNLKQTSTTQTTPTYITSPFVGVTTEANGYNSQYEIQFSTNQSET